VEIIQKLSSKIIQKLFSNIGLISEKSDKSVVGMRIWGRSSSEKLLYFILLFLAMAMFKRACIAHLA